MSFSSIINWPFERLEQMFTPPMHKKLKLLREEAQRQYIEHRMAAKHHDALAEMYLERGQWLEHEMER